MGEVPGWPAKMRRPRLSLTSDAPAAALLEGLRSGLDAAGFRIGRRTPTGFRARHVRWWSLLAAEWPTATNLEIRVSDGAAEITTDATWLESRVSQRAGRGLTAAVAGLRSQGFGVSTGEWTSDT